MSSYRNSNLLYRPSLSIWTARKLDKTESVKVAQSNDAKEGVANVHKQLLPDCAELEAVQKWANQFRTFIYTSTLPWDDTGWRIGMVARHMDFMSEVGDRIAMGEALVGALMHVYQTRIEEAKFTLNHMFKASDYPTVDEVRRKFHFSVEVMPMPSGDDFRVVDGIPKSEVEKLVKIATADTEQRIQQAMREAYERLYSVVSKMANTLEAYGNKTVKKFNDSLIENIAEIVAVMPALNLTNDPKLTALANDAKDLAAYSIVDLRTNASVRDAAVTEARTLAMKFKGVVAASIADDQTPAQTAAPKAAKRKEKPIVVNDAPTPEPVERSARVVADMADMPPPKKVSSRALFADMLNV
jgi:hypothetical protein